MSDKKIKALRSGFVEGTKSHKVSAQVDAFTFWAIEKLRGVGIGRNRSDVASFMLRDWLLTHRDRLEQWGITAQVMDGNLVVMHDEEEAAEDA